MHQTIALLLAYKYYILLPLSIVEGPIITVIAGFLASTHLINPFAVYGVVILGDLIGDTLLYSLGRWSGGGVQKYGKFLGVTAERLAYAKDYFANHHRRAVITSKLVHGIGVSGLVTAGVLRIPYMRYMRTCFFISLAQSIIFLFIGLLFGHAYMQIGHYLDYFAAGISTVALMVIIGGIAYRLKK